METVVERPAALDVHKEQVTACVRTPGGHARREQHLAGFKTTVRGLLALRDWLKAHGTHVAMEASGVYWKPPWAILEDEFECLLVNARHVKQVPGRKTDVSDAALAVPAARSGAVEGELRAAQADPHIAQPDPLPQSADRAKTGNGSATHIAPRRCRPFRISSTRERGLVGAASAHVCPSGAAGGGWVGGKGIPAHGGAERPPFSADDSGELASAGRWSYHTLHAQPSTHPVSALRRTDRRCAGSDLARRRPHRGVSGLRGRGGSARCPRAAAHTARRMAARGSVGRAPTGGRLRRRARGV